MKVLTYSSLYPSVSRPKHGVFVEERLRKLVETGRVEARVVAPVPWVPRWLPVGGRYAALRDTPDEETRSGIAVRYVRHPVIPKIGAGVAPLLLAGWTGRRLVEIRRQGFDFRLIDAQYFYPEGVAAAMLGRRLRRPVVITARGSDVNVFPEFAVPRRWIRWAARNSAHIITVSGSLRDRLVGIGVPEDHVRVLRNGVDLVRFRPADREAARRRLGLAGPVVLSVGNLLESKGHHLVIEALRDLPGTTLLVVGDGERESSLREDAVRHGVADRVRFVGAVTRDEMPAYYAAADVLALASSREGMPNVVLEALASGCPVVATRVGGIPEIVTDPRVGELFDERSATAVAGAIRALRERDPDRDEVRRYAESLGWDETIRDQATLFERIAGGPPRDR